jgi:D-3-phosphoglycerate dehydrogenase
MNMLSSVSKCVFLKIVEGRANCIFLFIKVLFICSSLTARPPMSQNPPMQIAIIDDFHPVFTDILAGHGLSYTYQPEVRKNDVHELIKDASIVAVRSKIQFDRELISALPHLKCIARGGAGMDNIDEEFAMEKGITLLNAPEGNRDAVAEHVIGLLLSLSKNIYRSAGEVSRLVWQREANRGWEIREKTIGIIGFGNTGSTLAKKLQGFDCRVLAYDKLHPSFISSHAVSVGLEQLLAESDVVSLHVPLNASTLKMVDAGFIGRMKDGSVLINSSRGKIVDATAVLDGIKRGKLKGFATDVLENEDFSSLNEVEKKIIEELYASNQAIITPHIAGWSTESYHRIAVVLAGKLLDFTTKSKII